MQLYATPWCGLDYFLIIPGLCFGASIWSFSIYGFLFMIDMVLLWMQCFFILYNDGVIFPRLRSSVIF